MGLIQLFHFLFHFPFHFSIPFSIPFSIRFYSPLCLLVIPAISSVCPLIWSMTFLDGKTSQSCPLQGLFLPFPLSVHLTIKLTCTPAIYYLLIMLLIHKTTLIYLCCSSFLYNYRLILYDLLTTMYLVMMKGGGLLCLVQYV